jgi:hypothetical protein
VLCSVQAGTEIIFFLFNQSQSPEKGNFVDLLVIDYHNQLSVSLELHHFLYQSLTRNYCEKEMKISKGFFIMALLLVVAIPAGAMDNTTSISQGWYVIHCNVYGANIYLDDKFVGTAPEGTLTVPVPVTGMPYKIIRVQKYGYTTFTDSITKIPLNDKSVDLYATLNPISSAAPTTVGGDMGWYVVHCNIDGATVFFDASNKGEISQGTVYVPVFSTGTPFQTLTVKKDGYTTYTANIEKVPGKGETIDLYATINALPSTHVTTPGLIGGDIGWYTIHCNVDGATVSFNNEEKGQIANGSLSVQVYVTGTPYRTFTVYKSGYVPYSGSIDQYPKKSETVDLYATLNADPATKAAPIPTTKSALPPEITGLSVLFGCIGALAVATKK